MSDDWGSHRRELDDEDEDEKDEGGLGRRETGGWPEDEPETGHFRSHWPDDDEPEESDEPPSGWPTPGSTWQRPGYDDAPREWQRTELRGPRIRAQRRPVPRRRRGRAVCRPAQPRSARPPLSRPAARRAGHARLDPHHRRRDPDRARAQGVGREPVPHPVVVDGADAELRERLPRIPAVSATRATACSRAVSASTSDLRPAATSWSSTRRRGSPTSAAKAARS